MPNAPGRDNGTRDNFVASGSESFTENSFNVRIDGRLSRQPEHVRPLQPSATSSATARPRSARGRPGARQPGRRVGRAQPEPGARRRLRVLAVAAGRLPLRLLQVQGQRAAVRLRHHAGGRRRHSRAEPRRHVQLPGCPAGFIEEVDRGASTSARVSASTAATARSIRTRSSGRWSATSRRCMGNHSFKFGVDVRRAYNLRVPSDAHRSGELTFRQRPHVAAMAPAASGSRRSSSATCTSFRRYVSPNTDAREQQWRHFYYAQDTWRAERQADAQLRPAARHHQPADHQRGGQRRLPRPRAPARSRRRRRRHAAERRRREQLNWAPRLGATYQIDDKTVLRGGFGRSYDIGVFGSLFGHSVTQNLPVLAVQELNAPSQLRPRLHAGARTAGARRSRRCPRQAASRCRTACSRARCPTKQRPPTVDAFNVIVQRQLTDTMSVEAGYVGNRGRRRVRRRRPGDQRQPADAQRVRARRAAEQPAAVLQQVRLDAGHRLLLQLRDELVRLAAGEVQQAVLARLLRQRELHAAARAPARRRLLRDRSPRAPGTLRQRSGLRAARLRSGPQLRVVAGRRAAGRPGPGVPVGHLAGRRCA